MKKIIKEEIFRKDYDGDKANVRFSDLPKDIQPNDIIDINREEKYISMDTAWDSFTELIVIREREETDEEYQKRSLENEKLRDILRKSRYENYLKLKAEFEPKI